jgi:predicted transcriptional regulator
MKTAKHRLRKVRAKGGAAAANKALDHRAVPKSKPLLTPEEKLLHAIFQPTRDEKRLRAIYGEKASDVRDTSVRKATTFRLDPALQAGLAVLGRVLKKPLNRLVNEAVRGFIEKCSVEVEADLERTIERLKACRQKDPRFESAIAQFVEAEASLGRDDPVEGRPQRATGPAQTIVHQLLRG